MLLKYVPNVDQLSSSYNQFPTISPAPMNPYIKVGRDYKRTWMKPRGLTKIYSMTQATATNETVLPTIYEEDL